MHSRVIISESNELVKNIRALSLKKNRDRTGRFVIEGSKVLMEAVNSGADIEYVLYSKDFARSHGEHVLEQLEKLNINIFHVDRKLIKQVSNTVTPQGIMAVVRVKENRLKDITEGSKCILVADRIQDPGNLGTIIRICHAACIDAVIAAKGTADIYNPKVIRSAMGSIFHVPVIKVEEIVDAVSRLKAEGFVVYSSDAKGHENFFDIKYNDKSVIIIGNEGEGVDRKLLEISNHLVKIPMPGNAESLNAAVSAGIFVYEMMRQREETKL